MCAIKIQMSEMNKMLVFARNLGVCANFYTNVLSLKVIAASKTQIELRLNKSSTLLLKEIDTEAECTTGFSPVLMFKVPNVDFVQESLVNYGIKSDGVITQPNDLKVP